MKYCFLALTLMITVGNTMAQALEFEVEFGESCRNEHGEPVSKSFAVNKSEKVPFVGISAFVMKAGADTEIFYRIRKNNGWLDWVAFRRMTEGHLDDRTAFEGPPLYGKVDKIQFRSSKIMDDTFTFRLFFPPAGKKKVPEVTDTQLGSCNCTQPSYCGRQCWCPDGSCPPDPNAVQTSPTHLIIHHSAGFNDNVNFKWVVAYYWDLHVNTNGWSDIGYNWLIDAEGTIYEGRGSGILGAHFSCLNSFTTGICMIGNFMDTIPTDTAMAQLKNLLAWEACDKNIQPDTSSWHQPSQMYLNNISAHRDANSSSHGCPSGTVCPGDSLYLKLTEIRRDIEERDCLQEIDLNDYTNIKNVQVFPQPATDELRIEWCSASGIESAGIYDLQGKLLWKNDDLDKTSNSILINTTKWSRGSYFIHLRNFESARVMKFLLK